MKLEVVLPEETATKGSVLIHQMKSLDFDDRQIELIEKAPEPMVGKVTELAKAIIQ
jgi:mRNA interferase MazF/mRNA interferase ChpB